MRRVMLVLVLVAVLCGCAIISSDVSPQKSIYLVAKTAAYGLWRFESVPLDRLQAARPHLETLKAALEATDEAALDRTLGEYLAKYIVALPLEADREIVGELIGAALDDYRLTNPEILTDERKKVALWVVGGLLDGIKHAEKAAAETPG